MKTQRQRQRHRGRGSPPSLEALPPRKSLLCMTPTGKAEAALEAKAEVKLGRGGRGQSEEGAGILLSFP